MSQSSRVVSGTKVTPLPLPATVRKVLFFGGVFDPPHVAHVELAANARDRGLGADAWLVFVPAAQSPLKVSRPTASDQDRVRMLELATAGLNRTAIWTDEIDRAAASGQEAPSYWEETLRRAKQVLPAGAEARFLIGADQAVQFHRWRSYRDILDLAAPFVLLRDPIDTVESLAEALRQTAAWSEPEVQQWRQWVIPGDLSLPSSTEARERLLAGDLPAARQLIAPAVLDYIQKQGLYSTPS